MFLKKKDFAKVIKCTPLVGIDLFVFSKNRKYILLEKRDELPAKNFLFNFGGRLQKNEKIQTAIQRISKREIDKFKNLKKIKFYDFSEHFYKNSYFGNKLNTHYVVLIFYTEIEFKTMKKLSKKSLSVQKISEANSNPKVHRYVKETLLKLKKR